MIFRTLVYKNAAALNKVTLEVQKEHAFSNIYTEENLKEAELNFAAIEERILKTEANLARACDVGDIILFAVIAQFISYANEFILGTVITRAIIILALVYSLFKASTFPKVIYLIPITLLTISIINDIN